MNSKVLLFHLFPKTHWGTTLHRMGSTASVRTFPVQPDTGTDEETTEIAKPQGNRKSIVGSGCLSISVWLHGCPLCFSCLSVSACLRKPIYLHSSPAPGDLLFEISRIGDLTGSCWVRCYSWQSQLNGGGGWYSKSFHICVTTEAHLWGWRKPGTGGWWDTQKLSSIKSYNQIESMLL